MIYYVKPLHSRSPIATIRARRPALPVSEELPKRILCLPMHPYLSEADQDRIIDDDPQLYRLEFGARRRRVNQAAIRPDLLLRSCPWR